MHWSIWRGYLPFLRASSVKLIVVILLAGMQVLLVVPMAWLIRNAFDQAIPTGDSRRLLLIGGLLFVLALVSTGVTLWVRYVTLATTKVAIQELRNELLDHCYALSRGYHTSVDRNKLHTILVQDTERVDMMSNALISQFFPSALAIAALSLVLIYLDPLLFGLAILVVPFFLIVNRLIGRRLRVRVRAFHRAFEAFSRGVQFVLQQMDLTRLHGAEALEIDRQRQTIDKLRITSGSMAWLHSAYASAQSLGATVSGILILAYGGVGVINGTLSIGEMLAFYFVFGLLGGSLRNFFSAVPVLLQGYESLVTLQEFRDVTSPLPYTGRRRISLDAALQLDSVTFGYEATSLLEKVNLAICPGSMVAVVGPNGVGKSTIAALILGFYRPNAGELRVGETRYDELDIRHLRRQIGVVMQDPILFSGTVWANIVYGRPDASRAAVLRAAKLASADEFIHKLPLGYETQIGEEGVLLSGGQRQRIAIARALLGEPRLLILDEPTNHLDLQSVKHLMRHLSQIEHRPSILLISHDADIVAEAHTVYQLGADGGLCKVDQRVERMGYTNQASDERRGMSSR